MGKAKTTLSIDQGLMRQVRVRAARTGRSDSEVLEEALREGLGIIDRIRAKARLDEEEAHELAHRVVHEGRKGRIPKRPSTRSSRS
jgi:plasmid stability protein